MHTSVTFSVKIYNEQGICEYQSNRYDTPKEALNAARVTFIDLRCINPEQLKDYTYVLVAPSQIGHMKYPMSWEIEGPTDEN